MRRRNGAPLVFVTTGTAAPRSTAAYAEYNPNRVVVVRRTVANSGSI